MTRFLSRIQLRSRKRMIWCGYMPVVLGLWISMCSLTSAQLTVESLLGSAVENPVASKYKNIADAITHFRSGEFQEARESLVAAHQKHKQLAPPDVMMAKMYLAINQTAAMRQSLENAVKEHRQDPEAYAILGEVAWAQRRFTESGLAYDKSLSLCEKYSTNEMRKNDLRIRSLKGLTRVAVLRGDWPVAKQYLTTWQSLAPNDEDAHAGMGQVLFQLAQTKADYEKAYAEFKKVYELNNRATRYEIRMAQLYDQKGERSKATNLIGLAIKRAGNDLNTRLFAANWYLEKGLLKEARDNAKAARKIDPNSFQAIVLQGHIARHEKQYAAAEAAFRAAHELSPRDAAVIRNLALSLVEQPEDQNKQRQALDWARLSSQSNSDINQTDGREAMVTLGWVLYRLGRDNEAIQAVSRAVQSGRSLGPESAYFAATILYHNSRPDLAKQLLDKVLASNATFPYRDEAERLQSQF